MILTTLNLVDIFNIFFSFNKILNVLKLFKKKLTGILEGPYYPNQHSFVYPSK